MALISTENINPLEISTIEAVHNTLSGTNIALQHAAAEMMDRTTKLEEGIDVIMGSREYERLPVVNDIEEMRILYDLATHETSAIQRTLVVRDDGIMLFDYKIRKVNGGFHVTGNPKLLALLPDGPWKRLLWYSSIDYITRDFVEEHLSSIANSHKIICSSPKSLDAVMDEARLYKT